MRKKKFTDDVAVINLTSHKTPVFKEVQGKDYVYYGEKNSYPQHLLDIFYKSSKHNAVINGKVKYISGSGWNENGDFVLGDDTLNEFTNKITLDLEIYGGFAVEVVWTKGGKAQYRHVDFSKVRSNYDGDKYYYTCEWVKQYGKEYTPNMQPENADDWDVYDAFDPNVKAGKQLIYYKKYTPGLDVYPLPEYKAALLYIELEYQVANYWYNRVKNGFLASAILNFYMGQPTDKEKQSIADKIGNKFTGTDNSGQFILNFASGKDFAADVQQLTPPELGAEYDALNKTLQTEIMSGHGVTSPMLFGIKEESQLGGRTELIMMNELFQNRYVTPIQNKLVDFFNAYIFPYIGVSGGSLNKQQLIGHHFSEAVVREFMPEDAIREMIGKQLGIDMAKYPVKKELPKDEKFKKSKEKIVLDALRKSGRKVSGKVLMRRPVTFEMSKDLKSSEDQVLMTFAKEKKPPVVIGKQTIPLDVPGVEKPTEILSVVYAYDWIEGFNDSDLTNSREFCQDLRQLTESGTRWKREDIDKISTSGYDDTWGGDVNVWEMRGGWYHDPVRDVNVPHCRHQWIQEVILETV